MKIYVTLLSLLLSLSYSTAEAGYLSKKKREKALFVDIQEMANAPEKYKKKLLKIVLATSAGENADVSKRFDDKWSTSTYAYLDIKRGNIAYRCPLIIHKRKRKKAYLQIIKENNLGKTFTLYGSINSVKRSSHSKSQKLYSFSIIDLEVSDYFEFELPEKVSPAKYTLISPRKLHLTQSTYLNKQIQLPIIFRSISGNIDYALREKYNFTTENHVQLSGSSVGMGNIAIIITKKNRAAMDILLKANNGANLLIYGTLHNVTIAHSTRMTYFIYAHQVKKQDTSGDPTEKIKSPLTLPEIFQKKDYDNVKSRAVILNTAKFTGKKLKVNIPFNGFSNNIPSFLENRFSVNSENHISLTQGSRSLGGTHILINKALTDEMDILLDAENGERIQLYGRMVKCILREKIYYLFYVHKMTL